MSFGGSAALQQAVFMALSENVELASAVSGAIFDAAPAGQIPSLYVTLGPEDVRDRSDGTGKLANHEFTVSVVSSQEGFSVPKAVAVQIGDILSTGTLELERGRCVSLNFLRASAKRGSGGNRRIDLKFRAQIEDI